MHTAIRSGAIKAGLAVATAAALIASAAAKDKPEVKAPVLDDVFACRQEADAGARVACYDRTVAALQDARARHQFVVLDQAGVRAAKRSIFGFSLPRFKLFANSGADEPEITEIDSTLKSVRNIGYDQYLFVLADDTAWQTTEGAPNEDPRTGQAIHIKAGIMGSYLAKVQNGRGMKVKRVR